MWLKTVTETILKIGSDGPKITYTSNNNIYKLHLFIKVAYKRACKFYFVEDVR